MRERDNYFDEIELAAAELLHRRSCRARDRSRSGRSTTSPRTSASRWCSVDDLPESTRTVIDLEHQRIYLPQAQDPAGTTYAALALQALGHVVLGHTLPRDYGGVPRASGSRSTTSPRRC